MLRLQHLTRLRMNLLIFNLAGIPPAAERFHQVDRADHLLTKQLRFQAFTAQQSSLRVNDIQIVRGGADVTVVGDGP